MIGNLLSMRYVGKRSWGDSLKFMLLTFVLSLSLTFLPLGGLKSLIYYAILVFLTSKWFKLKTMKSIWVIGIGVLIDVILLALIMALGLLALSSFFNVA